MEGIQNFKNRRPNVEIPSEITDQVVGFRSTRRSTTSSAESSEPPTSSQRQHHQRTDSRNCSVVGCNNARVTHDDPNLTLIKELIKNDVLVLVTGCSAMTCGKAGLLTPEATEIYAGAGLASVGRTVGIPPVLHMGACVDNSRS